MSDLPEDDRVESSREQQAPANDDLNLVSQTQSGDHNQAWQQSTDVSMLKGDNGGDVQLTNNRQDVGLLMDNMNDRARFSREAVDVASVGTGMDRAKTSISQSMDVVNNTKPG